MTILHVLLGSSENAAYGNDGNEHILLNREWAKNATTLDRKIGKIDETIVHLHLLKQYVFAELFFPFKLMSTNRNVFFSIFWLFLATQVLNTPG